MINHHRAPGSGGVSRGFFLDYYGALSEYQILLFAVGRLVHPTTHDLCIRSKNSFTWWNGTPAKRARLSSSAESPT